MGGITALCLFLAAPLLGALVGLIDHRANRNMEGREDEGFLVFSVAWLLFFVGTMVASVSLYREERPRLLAFGSFALNLIPTIYPVLALLGVALFQQ